MRYNNEGHNNDEILKKEKGQKNVKTKLFLMKKHFHMIEGLQGMLQAKAEDVNKQRWL